MTQRVVLLALGLLAVAGCNQQQHTAVQMPTVKGGVVRLPLACSRTDALDPLADNTGVRAALLSCTRETLVRCTADGKTIADLATEWSSDDGIKWVFKTDSGRAVLETWKRVLRQKDTPLAYQLADLVQGAKEFQLGKSDSISGIDAEPGLLTIALARPDELFPQWCSQLGLGIESNEVDSTPAIGSSGNGEPLASFVLDPKQSDPRAIMLRPNPSALHKAGMDGVEFVCEPDRHKQFELYKAGKLDACNLNADDLAEVKSEAELSKQLWEFDIAAPLLGFIDQHAAPWGNAPFKDKTPLRDAANYSLARGGIADDIGGVTAWPHLLPKPLKDYIDPPLVTQPRFNLLESDESKALEGLKLAGNEQASLLPTNMLLSYVQDPYYDQLATEVQQNLRDISIIMRPYPCKTRADALELVRIGSMDIWLQYYYPGYASPDAFFYPTLHSSLYGLGGNYGMLRDPQVDKLIESAQAEPDEGARKKLYQQLEREVERRSLFLFIGSGKAAMLINPKLAGYQLTPYDFDASLPAEDFSKLGFVR